MEKKESINQKNPIIILIESGLEFWIKQQCKKIDHLSISIDGKILNILRGKIDCVKVVAEKINFQDILISNANIKTSAMKVKLGTNNSTKKIKLSEFSIQGSLILSSSDINSIICSKSWVNINRLISNKLLDNSSIQSVNISDNLLSIVHRGSNKSSAIKSFQVSCNSSSIALKDPASKNNVILPMDESVKIIEANIDKTYLRISLETIIK